MQIDEGLSPMMNEIEELRGALTSLLDQMVTLQQNSHL
jgi:hypothetical protein